MLLMEILNQYRRYELLLRKQARIICINALR